MTMGDSRRIARTVACPELFRDWTAGGIGGGGSIATPATANPPAATTSAAAGIALPIDPVGVGDNSSMRGAVPIRASLGFSSDRSAIPNSGTM